MHSLESTIVIPMVLVMVFFALMLVFFIAQLDLFSLKTERDFLAEGFDSVEIDGTPIGFADESPVVSTHYFVVENLRYEPVQRVANPFAIVWNKEQFEMTRSYRQRMPHRIRMGLIAKYGESLFEGDAHD